MDKINEKKQPQFAQGNMVLVTDAVTANKAVTLKDSGRVFPTATDGVEFTCPADAPDGFTFGVKNIGADTAVGFQVNPESGGKIFGVVGNILADGTSSAVAFSGVADASIALTKATAKKGDIIYLTKYSDGWYAESGMSFGIYANV